MESLWKRTFDLLGASVALILLAPVVGVIFVRNFGRRQLVSSHTILSPTGDTRLRVFDKAIAEGPLLRGAPALLGVLRGRFSLVGPRPVVSESTTAVEQPFGLTAIKPGLTGPWRLTGPDATLAEQALQDLSYVRNYSIWEDLRIVWESVRRLQRGRLHTLLGRWETAYMRETGPAALFDHKVA
jgi:lipopolysaccharide/colanic/teichoic acid biosynthesis glycosyltransferase